MFTLKSYYTKLDGILNQEAILGNAFTELVCDDVEWIHLAHDM